MRTLRLVIALLLAVVVVARSFTTHAFDLPQHRNMTVNVLRGVHVTIAGKDRTFTKAAIDQVVTANEDTDKIKTGSAAWFRHERHFTDEAFVASTQNLLTLKREILEMLRSPEPNGNEARQRLGMAIYGIQDFYSHSGVSAVVIHELYYGGFKSQRVAKNVARVDALQFPVLEFDSEDAREVGHIRAHLASKGTPIGPYDVLIAAQARARELTLVTHNTTEFRRVPGLKVEDWKGSTSRRGRK